MLNTTFIDDMSARRTCARHCMIRCSQVGDDQGLQKKLVKVLNEALATQLICVLRYKAHDYSGQSGLRKSDVVKRVAGNQSERANTAQTHVDRLANRIAQLGGHADFNPGCLAQRDYRDYINSGSLPDLWREDFIACRIAVDIFLEMVRFIGARDPETRQLLEDILAEERQHADLLSTRIAALVNRERACVAAAAV